MNVRDELQTHIYGNNGEKMKWPEENNEKRNEEKRDVHCADKITFIFSASSKRFRSYSHWQTSFLCAHLQSNHLLTIFIARGCRPQNTHFNQTCMQLSAKQNKTKPNKNKMHTEIEINLRSVAS